MDNTDLDLLLDNYVEELKSGKVNSTNINLHEEPVVISQLLTELETQYRLGPLAISLLLVYSLPVEKRETFWTHIKQLVA